MSKTSGSGAGGQSKQRKTKQGNARSGNHGQVTRERGRHRRRAALPQDGEQRQPRHQPARRAPAAEHGAWDDPWQDDWDRGAWNRGDGFLKEYVPPVRLTAAERASSDQRAVRGLLRTVLVQVIASVLAAGLAFAMFGSIAGASVLAGAAAYVIPNALFAFKLVRSVNKPGGANPATFFLGEFFKIAVAGLLLAAVAVLGRDWLVWPAYLAGLVCALKSQWLTLAFGAKDF